MFFSEISVAALSSSHLQYPPVLMFGVHQFLPKLLVVFSTDSFWRTLSTTF